MDQNNKFEVVIVGLGYVGLPLALALANHFLVIGFDSEEKKIRQLNNISSLDKIDFADVKDLDFLKKNLSFTNNNADIKNANYYIVTVPTPIDQALKPDLS